MLICSGQPTHCIMMQHTASAAAHQLFCQNQMVKVWRLEVRKRIAVSLKTQILMRGLLSLFFDNIFTLKGIFNDFQHHKNYAVCKN